MTAKSKRTPLSLADGIDPPATAMVMAAGLGKRMRPLTVTRPKPLVEVAGKTLLDHTLDHLKAAGVKRVVVNVHYLADVLEEYLKNHVKDLEIVISDERDQLLETGGGLMKAKPLIPDDPFLCVNGDNFWVNGPLDSIRQLAARWDEDKMDALLLLVPQARAYNHNGMGDFHMDARGLLSRRKPAKVAPFVYIGIQLISKRLLVDAPEGAFSTNLFWNRAIEAGRCYGMVHTGTWFDVGTPAAIPVIEAMLDGG